MLNSITRDLTVAILLVIVSFQITETKESIADELTIQKSRKSQSTIAPLPTDLKIVEDISYREGNSKAWKLDLIMPKVKGDKKRPALVFVHGGGWRNGDKRRGFFHSGAIEFAKKGYVCINVNYRLTNEAPFPACVEDVKCTVRWLRAHAEKYNIDPNRIGGYGNSAGAHLVSMLGLVTKKSNLEGDGPWQEHSSLLNAVCASATPTDFPNWPGGYEDKPILRQLLKLPETKIQEQAVKASPISYVHAHAPPFLLFHGTNDRLVDVSQADQFVKALKAAGAKDVAYHRYKRAGHGVFNQHRKETHPIREAFFERTLMNPETNSKK